MTPSDVAVPTVGQADSGRARPGRAATCALVALVGLLLAVPVRSSVAVPVRISSSSMLPTLAEGDVVLVDLGVQARDLHRGDLLVFTSPVDGTEALKRVVGLPGERVGVRDALLHVDDEPVVEDYVDHAAIDGYYSKTFFVPVDTVFVMGDNRANSLDSRDYGPVAATAIRGRVLVRLWPPVRIGGPQPTPPKP